MEMLLYALGGVIVGLIVGVALAAVLLKYVLIPLIDWALD